ncbi:hypothetical protein [Candidatus Regiella endosymbiont of Tuberolachnus salignus]|uniref:hypothetical protein n=1 Tax=Candidatus Regiella endosymbiont of Tuberolachnus salignus TaxID=3077956 RepID=UPI0030D273E6
MKLPLGGQSVRPMSVDRLRDSANTRSQQHYSFKGEGYNHNSIIKSRHNGKISGGRGSLPDR